MSDRQKNRPTFDGDKSNKGYETDTNKTRGCLNKKKSPTNSFSYLLPPIRMENDNANASATRSYPRTDGEKSHRKAKGMSENNEVDIIDYLDRNREVLEAYVIDNVSVNQLEKWLIKKMSHNLNTESSSNMNHAMMLSLHGTKDTKEIFMDNEHSVILELARLLSISVNVDAYRVYKVFLNNPNFVQYFVGESTPEPSLIRADNDKIEFVHEVAKNGVCLRLSRETDKEFPKISSSLITSFSLNEKDANHVLYSPISTASGKTAYVIEMWRLHNTFEDKDEKITSTFVGSKIWHYCNLHLDKRRERDMSDFLLDLVKAIFEGMVSLDQVIKTILEFAQRLVNADRASMFLVDYSNFELVSTVFDLKFEPGQERDMEKKQIRMPMNRGIAGHVALSGETMNIPDAYSDYRFNREVDEATGYKTMNILCMPVKVQGKVIGVVQMVNKRNSDHFDYEDEVAFEIFSTFFGLALHHARLYDKIMRKEQRYRVALEVLSYHNTCKDDEVKEIHKDNYKVPENINDFYLDPYLLDDFQKCKAAISMFDDLFDLSKFDHFAVTRFILTVKKNYRAVPYHNFDHGWSVAHAMYLILKNDSRERFDYKMRLALFVACLCHDLDHRGYTNKYLNETASPLAAMYTTSPLEHHHFNITVTILQQDGHNIFSHLSSEEYKDILSYIKHCILATDLAAFFPNLKKFNEINDSTNTLNYIKFNWGNPGHRDLAMAISMTSADLSASAKPWKVQIKTVKVIFEEFYDQGDKERAAGKIPIPMMDRTKPEEQPASQVGFLSQICVPCYNMLYKILPKTKPMYLMSLENLKNWKSKVTHSEVDVEKDKEYFNDNTSEAISESHEDNLEIGDLDDELKFNNAISDIKNVIEDVHEDLEEIKTNWKCLKSNSSSCEDEHFSLNKTIPKDDVWKDTDGNSADDASVVTKPMKISKSRK